MKGYFRRFFVLKRDSKSIKEASFLIFEEVKTEASNLEHAIEKDSQLRTQAAGFANRLAMIKKMGKVPGVGTAPYYILIAEKKVFLRLIR